MLKSRDMSRKCSSHKRENVNVYSVLVGNFKGRYCHSVNLGVDGRIVSKQDGRLWTGFIWFKIGMSGRLFEHGNEHSEFVTMLGISSVTDQILASQERLVSMEFAEWE
jgi:hypothetical protein